MTTYIAADNTRVTVYRALNLINGKFYIGITGRPLRLRATHHRSSNPNTRFGHAMRKYGKDMFHFHTLKICASREEAKAEERRLIALWKPAYNATDGGDGGGWIMTAEQRRKITLAKTGFKWSDASRQKLSQSKIGKRQNLTTEQRAERRLRISSSWVQHGIPVTAFPDGMTFMSLVEACRHYGLRYTNVWHNSRRGVPHKGILMEISESFPRIEVCANV